MKDEEIKEMLKRYFEKLLNEKHLDNSGEEVSGSANTTREYRFYRRIRKLEVECALKKMKLGKALGPDGIPIEMWKCLVDEGVSWLTII